MSDSDKCICKHRWDDHAETTDGKYPCAGSEFCLCGDYEGEVT